MPRSHRHRFWSFVACLLVLLVACAPAATPTTPAATLPPTVSVVASPTQVVSPTTAPTALPAVTPETVTMPTPDGASLSGQRYGAGEVAVIFSPMGDCAGDWAGLPEALAAQGFMALTFSWRACGPAGSPADLQRRFLDDLRGAVDFVREAGAERIVLAGASLGGVASARLLVESGASGLLVVAAPASVDEWNLHVAASHLASPVPKLFLTAEADDVVPVEASRALYNLAADPKDWQTFPGAAHGLHLLAGDDGAAVRDHLLAFLLEAAAAPPPPPTPTAEPPFFTVSSGPVVSEGTPGEWDYPFTDPGAVLYHDGLFHMFRNGFQAWPASVQIGYVTSPDGEVWTKQGDEPVFTTAEVPYAGLAALASSALVEPDGTWVLYFYTWPSAASSVGGGIGRATAPAPTGPWTPDPDLVLKPGSAGAWDADQVLAPHVLRTDDGYVMYYSGSAGRRGQVGRADSADGVNWTKYDDPATTAAPYAESDPVLSPADGSAWDGGTVHQPSVFQTDSGWAMLYRGLTPGQPPAMAMGLALSADGLHWERSPLNPVLTPRAVPGARAFWFTSALHHEDTVYLYWEVGRTNTTNIYLATHSGPLE